MACPLVGPSRIFYQNSIKKVLKGQRLYAYGHIPSCTRQKDAIREGNSRLHRDEFIQWKIPIIIII